MNALTHTPSRPGRLRTGAASLALGMAALISTFAHAAHAQHPSVNVQISSGHPQPVVVVPAPAPRYVAAPPQRHNPRKWVPGHWERSGHHHRKVWIEGHWETPKPRWDRDGDGVPNRHDRQPNNPYR